MNLLYAPFTKIEETPDGLIVEGIATTERVDVENESVDYDSVKACLPDYEQWGNIRAMHQPIAAGRALVVTPDDTARTVYLRALVVDEDSQKKVRSQVYKGFSIGGKADPKVTKRTDGSTYTRRFVTLLSEISLVDRPANPDARFTIVKMTEDTPMSAQETQTQQPAAPALDADTVAKLQKLAGTLQPEPLIKASADPAKIVAMIQQARNELEMAGDMDGAQMLTQAITLVQQVIGEADPPAEEETTTTTTEEPSPEDSAMVAQRAKTGNLRKAGRSLSGANLAAMENTVKTLLAMMASAGSAKAQKAITAMSDGDEMSVASAIGAEFTKAVQPLAQAVLAINDRLDRVPTPGGPMLRQVEKVITGQKPPANQKPEATALVKAQLANLQHLARTSATTGMRQDYQKQYDELLAQYQ